MTLTELRYIIALARERHFSRAAQSCHVSQPTLSVAVKKLEEELGVTLFERGKNEANLTPVGENIVAQAQRVLEEVEGVQLIADAGRDQLSAPLRLGAIYTIGPYLLPHLIPELQRRTPGMPLIIEENFTARLSEQLRHGELDAILIALPFEEPGVVTLPLYDEPFVVLLPAAHAWCTKKSVSAKELAKEAVLLLGAGHCFRDQVLKVCPKCAQADDAHNARLALGLQGSSLETMRHMVASGMGITVLPCTAAGTERYAEHLLEIRPFTPPAPRRTVALAWRHSFPRPRAIEALRQTILACKLACTEKR